MIGMAQLRRFCHIRSTSALPPRAAIWSDDIAAAQFAVDGEIEHRQVACSPLNFEVGSDCPDVFLSKRRPYAM
jgi:hypothetical protein